MQTITSLPHQRAVIDQLVASCPRQHGMLVAHQMGTGKTLTALMFLNNFPKSRHVILCPVFLKDLYDRESLRLLGKPLIKSEIIAYTELEERLRLNPDLLDNAVLVMDEAHYLLELFNGMDFQKLYTLLSCRTKKCLALTGTPIHSSIKDLRILINICAGKEIMPLKETEFIKIFTRPKYGKTLFYGYFLSGLTSMWSKIVITSVMVYLGISINKKISTVDALNNFSLRFFENLSAKSGGSMPLSTKSLKRFMSVLLESLPGRTRNESYYDPLPAHPWEDDKAIFRFVMETEEAEFFDSSAKLLERSEVSKSMWETYLNDPQTHPVFRSLGTKKGQTFLVIALISLSLVVIRSMLYLLNLLHRKMSVQHDPMFYRALDYGAMKTALSPYLSYYKLKPGTNGVPLTKERSVYIMYDIHQTKIWTRMIYNQLSDADLKDLGLSKGTLDYTKDRLGTFGHEVTPQSYEKWGRMISNVSPPGRFPAKFEQCFRLMCLPWGEKIPHGAVVYSDFQMGTQNMMDFLARKVTVASNPFRYELFSGTLSAERKIEIMEDFANQKINVIVLEAGLYEGFSFFRASQMHILDPPENYKNLAQLMGRVVRMHSHDGLPPGQQVVEYFHYVATFSPSFGTFLANIFETTSGLVYNKLGYLREFLNLWKESQTYKQKLPSSYNPSILETLTPEALVFSRLLPLRELVHNIETTISTTVQLPAMQCCPKYETDGRSAKCLGISPCDDDSVNVHGA